MADITIKSFVAFLKQYKDVCITFQQSCANNNPAIYRYQLSNNGLINEVFNYNKTVYPICNINDTRSMCDNFLNSLRCALKMEATSDKYKTDFKGIL